MYINIKKLHISPVFLSVVAFFLIVDSSLYTVLILLCAALHELAHLLTGRLLGAEIEGVFLRPFGINIVQRDSLRLSYRDEALIALFGPLSNLLLAVLVYGYCRIFGVFEGAAFLIFINLALALVNLLPIECLDGGRILKNLLLCSFAPQTVDRVTLLISFLALIPLTLAAVFTAGISGYNLSLVVITIFLLIRVVIRTIEIRAFQGLANHSRLL